MREIILTHCIRITLAASMRCRAHLGGQVTVAAHRLTAEAAGTDQFASIVLSKTTK